MSNRPARRGMARQHRAMDLERSFCVLDPADRFSDAVGAGPMMLHSDALDWKVGFRLYSADAICWRCDNSRCST